MCAHACPCVSFAPLRYGVQPGCGDSYIPQTNGDATALSPLLNCYCAAEARTRSEKGEKARNEKEARSADSDRLDWGVVSAQITVVYTVLIKRAGYTHYSTVLVR